MGVYRKPSRMKRKFGPYTFLYVPCPFFIRSVQTSIRSVKHVLLFHTFLYVPCKPSTKVTQFYTFLYVPYTFLIRSPPEMTFYVLFVYVPIRSVQTLHKSVKSSYVPIRSLYVPHTFSLQKQRLVFCTRLCFHPPPPGLLFATWSANAVRWSL